MQEEYTIIWSFRNRFNVLKNSIESADKTTPKRVAFCLVDAASNDETIKNLRSFCNTIEGRIIRICESSYRSSLSEAWNLGMMLTNNRYVIFSSSDVEFLKPEWFIELDKYRKANSAEYVLIENHAVFLLDKAIVPKIGWFDEEFAAGPHFDCDYMIRASEGGVRVHGISNLGYYKHPDFDDAVLRSTTEVKDRLPMHDLKNEEYFKIKWLSGWPGWKDYMNQVHKPHPPTHINQVKRTKPEIDPHPIYTKKCR
jgi:glycosyltransferase involved in cell wall biosynthesis